MKEFLIDEQYLTSIAIHKTWNTYTKNGRKPTPDELLKIIKGEGNCSTTSTDDHPEFTKLRDALEADGFIKTERTWWNGDRVLKPFKLNGHTFQKGEQFSCAGAMKYHLTTRRKKKDATRTKEGI